MPPAPEVDKRQAAREVIDILHEIATLLNTHLNRQQLSYCVSLIENGVNPEALAVRPLKFPPPINLLWFRYYCPFRCYPGGISGLLFPHDCSFSYGCSTAGSSCLLTSGV
ncbi:hypothetical protein AOQ84DRAFT_343955 [Glonium stellatum]|uniref:Mitotic-spindle organizing protein 1 n=1 Tax=Glonium stellatum TaxID=574774 RepID=A0A8E2EWF3_9PEZI|nr:hypothetical protein AOQ84DRAFT_343955 [Glonium stellatum]